MSIDVRQFRDYVVAPVLHEMGLHSLAAERLVLGTAAHESDGFRFLDQTTRGPGPAYSWYQIEEPTYRDLMERTIPGAAVRRPAPQWTVAIMGMVPRRYAGYAPVHVLWRDLGLATAVCRALYFRVPRALPDADDIDGLAGYWKQYYNTVLGAGRPEQWVAAYQRHVAPIYR